MKNIFIGLVIMTTLTSCGGKKKSSDSSTQAPLSPEQSFEDYSKVSVDAKARDGLAVLLVKLENSMRNCTAFMINETQALTAASCLLSVENSKACSESVTLFVKTGTGQEKRQCAKITKISRNKNNKDINFSIPDYAVIELNKPVSGIKSYMASRDGIIEKEDITIESFETVIINKEIQSTYKVSHCIPYTMSRAGNYSEARSTIVPLFSDSDKQKKCESIPGSSGSPVLNSKGEVVGVSFAGKVDDDQRINYTLKEKVESFVLATNLSCLKLGVEDLDKLRSEDCAGFLRNEKSYKEKLLKKANEELLAMVGSKSDQLKKNLPNSFDFDVESKTAENKTMVMFAPKCAHPLDNWSEEEKGKIISSGFFGLTKNYSTNVPYFYYTFTYVLDKYLKLEVVPKFEEGGVMNIQISKLKRTLKKEKIETTLSLENGAKRVIEIEGCKN